MGFFRWSGRGLNPEPKASEEDALSTPPRPTWLDVFYAKMTVWYISFRTLRLKSYICYHGNLDLKFNCTEWTCLVRIVKSSQESGSGVPLITVRNLLSCRGPGNRRIQCGFGAGGPTSHACCSHRWHCLGGNEGVGRGGGSAKRCWRWLWAVTHLTRSGSSGWKLGKRLQQIKILFYGIKKKHFTTFQSVMNAKLSLHRFWPCHENGLIKTILTIPHNL